jgi:hypothetical protein
MDAPQHITALINRRIAQGRKALSHPHDCHLCSGDHPLLAILIATLEAAVENGLVEPLHLPIEGNIGTVQRSTIKRALSGMPTTISVLICDFHCLCLSPTKAATAGGMWRSRLKIEDD